MAGAIQKQPLVIGLTGPFGAGCTTVALVLEKMDFQSISLSDGIKEKLKKQEEQEKAQWEMQKQKWEAGGQSGEAPAEPLPVRVEQRRRKLQDIGNEGRKTTIDCWLHKALEKRDPARDLVIDSIRNHLEIESLRTLFTNALVIAVTASRGARWGRVKNDYEGNEKLFDRDDRRDADEEQPFGQHVQKCVDSADYVVINDDHHGSSTNRESALRELLQTDIAFLRGKTQREPTPDESHMATAYAQSHRSLCLKRHVGALIVDVNGRPISLGYNENPVSIQPCKRDPGYCIKDSIMDAELEELRDVYCPACGVKNPKLSKPYICCNQECRENLKFRFYPSRNIEKCTAIHAEEQAINSLYGRSAQDATIYSTTFPCVQCARRIIDAGIKRVVYVEAYPIKEAHDFLKKGGVRVEPFSGFKARYFNTIFKQVD